MLPIDQAVALVERVRSSAEQHAEVALDSLAKSVPDVSTIALRIRPPLPASIGERIQNYRARNLADWVMYRTALAAAAEARGWRIHWYEAKNALESVADRVEMRDAVGAPWTKDHKLAMAAALAAVL